jgi:hypothetical protein
MADKTRLTIDTDATQLALQRVLGGSIPSADHNVVAGLRARDSQLWNNLCPSGIVAAETPRCTIDESTGRIAVPTAGKPILAICRGMWVDMGDECEEAGTVTASTADTITDTGLDPASDNFWETAWVIPTSGVNSGVARQVSQYDATLHKLTVSSAWGAACGIGDTFVITFLRITGTTNGAVNYVFLTIGTWTPQYGIAEFYANTSGSPDDENDLLVATMTLDGGGVVTASDNSPSGAARYLYPLIGRYDDDVQSVTVHSNVAAGGTVAEFDATHDQMAAVAGLEVELSNANFSYEITKAYEDDRVTMTLTNNSAYVDDCTVTVTRKGIKLQKLP